MAQHTVKVKFTKRIEVLSKDLEVQVKRNGSLIGTLKISKGSLDWRDASDKKSHVVYWETFREFAKSGIKKRKR